MSKEFDDLEAQISEFERDLEVCDKNIQNLKAGLKRAMSESKFVKVQMRTNPTNELMQKRSKR